MMETRGDPHWLWVVAEEEISKIRLELEGQRRTNMVLHDAYSQSCKLVADMHHAVMGDIMGPDLGVVEDVEYRVHWLYERIEALENEIRKRDNEHTV